VSSFDVFLGFLYTWFSADVAQPLEPDDAGGLRMALVGRGLSFLKGFLIYLLFAPAPAPDS